MKQRTKSSVKKRTKVTGSGKIMVNKAAKRHLLSSKSKRQKKKDMKGMLAPAGHVRSIKQMLAI